MIPARKAGKIHGRYIYYNTLLDSSPNQFFHESEASAVVEPQDEATVETHPRDALRPSAPANLLWLIFLTRKVHLQSTPHSTPSPISPSTPPTDMPDHGSSSPLQRAHIHSPITALAFFFTNSSTPCNYILSGEDTHLYIRDAATSVVWASVEIFPAQPIHGICVSSCSRHVLIWGASSVAVLPRSTIELLVRGQTLSSFEVLQAPDWVYHSAISDFTSSSFSRAVLVTAHNEVLPLHILPSTTNDETTVRLKFGKLRAPRTSRPILYSAQVRWTNEDEVLVAAGTVFGEIIVWRCRGLDDNRESDQGVQVLFVFTGHEGSIFGVDISPDIFVPAEDSTEKGAEKRMRLLASCSDDRTIRIWDISSDATTSTQDQRTLPDEKEDGQDMEKHRHHFTEARETGFGENIPSLEASASHVSSNPLAMAMGHVSRIWNVRFATTKTQWGAAKGGLTLYSFGEDASAQKWRLDLSGAALDGQPQDAAGGTATLSHQAIMLRHNGKHIWSSAILGSSAANNNTRTLIATGGSDGKINFVEDVEGGYPGSAMLTVSGSEVCSRFPSTSPGIAHNQNKEAEQEQQATSATIAVKKRKKKTKEGDTNEEPFQMYAILSNTSFLATTPAGRIFKGSLLSGNASSTIKWEETPLEQNIRDDLRQYQIVRGLKAKADASGLALLASTTGNLYLYSDKDRSVRRIYQMPGKIADVFPLPSADALPPNLLGTAAPEASSTTIPIIVTTMGNPQPTRLLILELSDGGAAAAIRQEHTIELDKGFIVTAAGCCRGYLVLGSRNGALAVYKATKDEEGTRPRLQQITRIDKLFTKDAVSTIVSLPPKNPSASSTSCPYFLTTSRDGRYRVYELVTTTSDVEARLRHEAVPPLGPYIEGAFFTTNTEKPELILSGFRSQDFIVWNESRRTEIAKVECGGAYRSFTYHVGDDQHKAGRDITFVWTRASRTCIYSYTSSPLWRDAELQQGETKANPNANAAGITTLKPGGHGREIKAVAAWGDLLATGAEDTTLRIWRVSNKNQTLSRKAASPSTMMECLAVVEKHTAGIQHLKWVESPPSHHRQNKDVYLVSSSGNEELFLWRVSTLPESRYDGLAVTREAAYGDKTRDGDLRIMGFDVQGFQLNQEEEQEEVNLVLSLVLSNSTLRTYSYSKINGFSLLAEGKYTGACLLQIRHLHLGPLISNTAAEMHVLTTSTDGHIALWKTTATLDSSSDNNKKNEYTSVETLPLHQSSIKSLDLHPLSTPPAAQSTSSAPASSYLLTTGGDDNALGITYLTPSPEPASSTCLSSSSSYRISSRSLVNSVHAAAITGLAITSVNRSNHAFPAPTSTPTSTTTTTANICTTSTDQRVKSWRITNLLDGNKEVAAVPKVTLIANRYSSVADCGDLELIKGKGDNQDVEERRIIVAGVGLEIWKV